MKKIGLSFSLIALLIAITFVSCASSKVEEVSVKAPSINREFYYEDCMDLLNEGDYENFDILVNKWESIYPDDTELLILKANKCFSLSRTSTVAVETTPPTDGTEYTKFYDIKQGQEFYTYNIVSYDQSLIDEARDYLYKALKDNLDRLDLYFGLSHIFIQSQRYKEGEASIVSSMDRYKVNNGSWLWTFNKDWFPTKQERDLNYVISIHDYLSMLYNANSKEAYKIAQRISSKLLEDFSDNAVVLNFLAVDYLNEGNLSKGGELLRLAHEVDPTDLVIIDNLAYYYGMTQDVEGFSYAIQLLQFSGDKHYMNRADELTQMFWSIK